MALVHSTGENEEEDEGASSQWVMRGFFGGSLQWNDRTRAGRLYLYAVGTLHNRKQQIDLCVYLSC